MLLRSSRKVWPRVAAAATILAIASPCLAAPPDPLLQLLERAEAASSLDQTGMQPWHLKLTIKLNDAKGAPDQTATVEEWWGGPGLDRRIYTTAAGAATYLQTHDGAFRTIGAAAPPTALEYARHQVVHPIPGSADLDGLHPELNRQTYAKSEFDCILLAPPQKDPLHPHPIPSQTYCLEHGQARLRMAASLGSQIVVRQRVGMFQGREVPVDFSIGLGKIALLSAHIDILRTQRLGQGDFAATPDLEEEKHAQPPIEEKLLAGTATSKADPIYPDDAKARGLSGKVIVRAIIGKDGHIRDPWVESSPNASFALSALEAVRKWTYKPYLLNGQPTEVETTITTNYNFGPQ